MRIKRNISVVKALIKLRFQNLMMLRLGFFGPFFVDGSLFFTQLLVFNAVYSNVDRIGTWGQGEMIVFIGTFSMINALNMVIYFFGINDLSKKIKNGDLDLYLTKPVSPLLRLTFERVNPGSVPLVFMSGFIIAYGIQAGNIEVTLSAMLRYCFWIVVMTALLYELEVLIRSLSFFVISTDNIVRIEEAGLGLCMQLPGIVFHGGFKVLFYCILPYGIMATIPVQSMIHELSWEKIGYVWVILFTFTGLTYALWHCGIRHYNSASS